MGEKKFSRREFLKSTVVLGAAGLVSVSAGGIPLLFAEGDEDIPLDKVIAVSEGKDPAALTQSVLETLGGMKQFVKKGDVVVVKPNIAWKRAPEFAATTNPQIVAFVVKEALKAGAKVVKVLDRTCNEARGCYRISGIAAAAKEAGAEVIFIENRPAFFKDVDFPKGKVLKSWPIVKEVLNCNVLINLPIAKHHGLTKLTLGIKNLMGVMGGNRGKIHKGIGQKLADLLTVIRPHLTIMDAFRVLVRHGPTGGRLEDVKLVGKVMAGVDPVAVDAYTATLEPFGLTGEKINYVKSAAAMGLGEIDLTKVKVIKKKL